MGEKITFTVDGVDLTVILPTMSKIKRWIETLKSEVEEYDDGMYTMYSEEMASREVSLEDVQMMEQYITLYTLSPDMLLPYVEGMKKKKNKTFYKRAINSLFCPEHLSRYYEDYYPAWQTSEVCLEVIDDTTCELVIVDRTYKH